MEIQMDISEALVYSLIQQYPAMTQVFVHVTVSDPALNIDPTTRRCLAV